MRISRDSHYIFPLYKYQQKIFCKPTHLRCLMGDMFIPSRLSFPLETWYRPILSIHISSGSLSRLSISWSVWIILNKYPYLPFTKFNLNKMVCTQLRHNWSLIPIKDILCHVNPSVLWEFRIVHLDILTNCFLMLAFRPTFLRVVEFSPLTVPVTPLFLLLWYFCPGYSYLRITEFANAAYLAFSAFPPPFCLSNLS